MKKIRIILEWKFNKKKKKNSKRINKCPRRGREDKACALSCSVEHLR
jgi:hypothetical protein